MLKKILLLNIFLILLLVTACDVNDNLNDEKQVIKFTINKMARNLAKQTTLSTDLSNAKKAIISLSNGDLVQYENIELDLISWGDEGTFRTDIIEVEANINFSLTQFELRDENDVTIFAAPITGAPFSNLVNQPLPLPVIANVNEQNAVVVEVLSTEESSPADFGYPYFDVILKSKNAFSVVVKAEGNLVESKLKLTSGSYIIEKHLSLGKNIIEFDTSFDEYNLSVSKDGYTTYNSELTKEELIGQHINVTLSNSNGSSSGPAWTDYEIKYVTEFPNASNTGINGAGLSIEELTKSENLQIMKGAVYTWVNSNYDLIGQNYPNNIIYDEQNSELIIEKMNVTDGIFIKPNCGIKKVIIRKCYVTDGHFGIGCLNGDETSVIIEDCTVTSPTGSQRKAIMASNAIVRRCDISNYLDGIYFANNVVIESNYVHDIFAFEDKHADGLQGCAKNVLIVNNNVDAIGHNACLMTSDQTGTLSNMWVEHNNFAGGNYVVYVVDKSNKQDPSYTIENIVIKNNIFAKNKFNHGYIASSAGYGTIITGNVDENGTLYEFNNQ